MKILDGQKLADKILAETKAKIKKMAVKPRLAFIFCAKSLAAPAALFGRLKHEAARKIGLRTTPIRLPENANTQRLINLIERLNKNKDVAGIVVQLPLPERADTDQVLNSIVPEKDIDGLGEKSEYAPAAAGAIMRLLKEYKIEIANKKVVVLGAGRLIGKPVVEMLKKGYGARVMGLREEDYQKDRERWNKEIKEADVLILATGKPGIVGVDDIKKGAAVIDCGNTAKNREFRFNEKAEQKLKALSPVPGGIGPLTIACLLERITHFALERKFAKFGVPRPT